jgi:peptidoglycan/LPS O-acetylase OafA/YrhL
MATLLTAVSAAMLYFVVARAPLGFVDDIPARLSLIGAATLHVFLMLGYLDREDVRVPAVGRYLGDASYSLYLFHMFGIGVAKVVLNKVVGTPLPLAAAIPAGICGMAAGLLAYHLLEKPIMDWFKQRRKSQAKRQSISLEPAPPVT